MTALAELVNSHIRELAPYVPGKPVEALERELGVSGAVKLASNENPLGPSPRALAALRGALEGVNRYPDACTVLRERLADKLSVNPDQLVFGSGSDEILELLAKTFLAPGREVVYAWPSFAMYPIVTQGMGAISVPVPLDVNFVHDLPALLAAVTDATRLLFVCNPNNPTGTSVGAKEFSRFVEALPDSVVLVIDEAYFEYVRREDFPSSLALLNERPATIVLRTFSKIYGLAGLRVGYGVSSAELAGFLERARHPFNVNRLAETAALAALDDAEHVERSRRVNAEGLSILSRELVALGFQVWPSDANFVLVRTGEAVCEKLLREGVIVRPLGEFGLSEFVRISVGLPEENERVLAALRRIGEVAA